VDVGDLHVALYLQQVNLIEGLQAVEEVKQVLPVHKHLEPQLTKDILQML